MKVKRAIFIGCLLLLFVICYSIMNKHFDPLARYKYANNENRDLIIENLSSEDINYLIDRQLEPEEFIPYFGTEGFNIRYTYYYNVAKAARPAENQVIVDFVNQYLDVTFNHDNLEPLVRNYTYDFMTDFFENGDRYAKNEGLLIDPSNPLAVIIEGKTLAKYTPENLVEIVNVPGVNAYDETAPLRLRQEAASALSSMCAAASEINGKTCGNMILVGGFVSYEEQERLYEEALLHYGADDVEKYAVLPGHLENQLGFTAELQLAKVETESEEAEDGATTDVENAESEEAESTPSDTVEKVIENVHIRWLKEHAAEYGFIIRYPEISEGDRIVLRYVGVDNAKKMQEKGLRLEDMDS